MPPLQHSKPPSLAGSSSEREIVEFTKDGSVSRMRSHKGNIPSLPQTKLCPMCPAKFTRTTHLNRHLRTHSNERLHECDRCHSQFTRSDLLSRHKRSCGDPSSAHRSRRKSCQGCAESKVKCDQQQPCSKCQARGRECVYRSSHPVHGTRASASRRNASLASRSRNATASGSNLQTPAHTSSSPHAHDSIDHSFRQETSVPTNNAHYGYSSRIAGQYSEFSVSPPVPFDSVSVSSVSYASSTTATSDYTGNYHEPHPQFSFAQEAVQVQNQLNALFSNEMFDKFFNDPIPQDLSQHIGVDEFIVPEMGPRTSIPSTGVPLATNTGDVQPFMAAMERVDYEGFKALYSGDSGLETMATPQVPRYDLPMTPEMSEPTPSELQYYLQLFIARFAEQMPIVHGPTFTLEGKPQILVSAVHACGALYVRTPAAAQFIDNILSSAREQVVAAFASNPKSFEDRIHLILAVGLLQTIGLFHNRPEQRAQSNMYHAMLVMMIRQSGLMQHNANWTPPPLDDLHAAWTDWVAHETAKRALTLSFLHDCCHTIFFNLRPTFLRDEVNILLPCENALWKAGSALEWHYVLTQHSVYGPTTYERLCGGPSMQSSIARLATVPAEDQAPLILNPFSQFVIIHAILRFLFEDCIYVISESSSTNPSGSGSGSAASTSSSASTSSRSGSMSKDNEDDYSTKINLVIQYMLHNWLQTYFHSPESRRPSSENTIPVFVHDALPFYWIAQVSLLAYQEGLPPFASETQSLNASGEAKYCLMKEWFKHIREFLKRGEQGPTLFWDELMKIRMQSLREGDNVVEGPDGILDFFQDEKKDGYR